MAQTYPLSFYSRVPQQVIWTWVGNSVQQYIHTYILSAMLFRPWICACCLVTLMAHAQFSSFLPPSVLLPHLSPPNPLNLWSNKRGSLIRKTVQSVGEGRYEGVHGFTLKTPVQFKEGVTGEVMSQAGQTRRSGDGQRWTFGKVGGRCDVGGYTLIWRGNSNQLGGYTTRR